MATQLFTRSRLLSKPQQALASLLSRSLSFSSAPASSPHSPLSFPSFLSHRLRPLSAASAEYGRRVAAVSSARSFATRSTISSFNVRCTHWNPSLRQTMYVNEYNFTHWNVLMDKRDTGDDFMDSCVKTLAQVIGSEEEAKMRIYSVLVGHFYIKFGAMLPVELAYKLNDLPTVQLACPDAFRGLKYFWGMEDKLFPYEREGPCGPEYDEECLLYNARANERDGRDDRPCNFDRLRNFERRENMQNRDFQAWDMPLVHDEGMQNPPPQGNMPPPDMGGGMPPPSNFGRMPLHKQEHTLITCPSLSLNDLNPNLSDHHTEEAIFACIMFPENDEVNHWLVVMEDPVGEFTKDEIVDIYIKTLMLVVGSEEEARMKIYSVDTGPYYYSFAVLVSRELAYNLVDLPIVRWVVPDTYLRPKIESYLNGQAVPYDPEYHEEWVGNNARANERDGNDDQPCNFDRSRNFERRMENMQNRDFQARDMPPVHDEGMQNPPPQGNMPPPDMGGGMPSPSNFGRMPLHKQGAVFIENLRMCTHDELLRATRGFSPDNEVGEGAVGSVYKGTLNDGTVLTIKVLYRVTTRSAGVLE